MRDKEWRKRLMEKKQDKLALARKIGGDPRDAQQDQDQQRGVSEADFLGKSYTFVRPLFDIRPRLHPIGTCPVLRGQRQSSPHHT